MLTIDDLMPRVEKGAAWLERTQPGALLKVDIDTLDMSDCLRCVLGQLHGNFHDVAPLEKRSWAIEHGFTFDTPDSPDAVIQRITEWRRLRECWVTVLLSRRAEKFIQPEDGIEVISR